MNSSHWFFAIPSVTLGLPRWQTMWPSSTHVQGLIKPSKISLWLTYLRFHLLISGPEGCIWVALAVQYNIILPTAYSNFPSSVNIATCTSSTGLEMSPPISWCVRAGSHWLTQTSGVLHASTVGWCGWWQTGLSLYGCLVSLLNIWIYRYTYCAAIRPDNPQNPELKLQSPRTNRALQKLDNIKDKRFCFHDFSPSPILWVSLAARYLNTGLILTTSKHPHTKKLKIACSAFSQFPHSRGGCQVC